MPLWGGTSNGLLDGLQVLQNRAARLVTKLGIRTPVKILLTQCGWLSVRQLVAYHTLVFVYKSKMGLGSQYFKDKFSITFGHETRLATGGGIKLTKMSDSELGKESFSYRGIKLWNKLPSELRKVPTVIAFKRKLKKWIRTHTPVK